MTWNPKRPKVWGLPAALQEWLSCTVAQKCIIRNMRWPVFYNNEFYIKQPLDKAEWGFLTLPYFWNYLTLQHLALQPWLHYINKGQLCNRWWVELFCWILHTVKEINSQKASRNYSFSSYSLLWIKLIGSPCAVLSISMEFDKRSQESLSGLG